MGYVVPPGDTPITSPQASWVRMLKYFTSGIRISREASKGRARPPIRCGDRQSRAAAKWRAGAAGECKTPHRHRNAGGFDFTNVFDAFAFHGAYEAGGDADRFAGFELGLDFVNDVGIGFGLFGQQDHVGLGGKMWQNVHRQADHAQIIVKKLFAGGVIGRVGLYADGLADVDQHLVHLAEGIGGNVGKGRITAIGTDGFQNFVRFRLVGGRPRCDC